MLVDGLFDKLRGAVGIPSSIGEVMVLNKQRDYHLCLEFNKEAQQLLFILVRQNEKRSYLKI